jgi:coenzyme F420-reducing hydrogenase delta subunit
MLWCNEMNERIKNFYDQVGLDFENFQRVTVTKGDMEKFAELIIRECQHRVEQYISECGEVASMPKSVILKHFGVAEE